MVKLYLYENGDIVSIRIRPFKIPPFQLHVLCCLCYTVSSEIDFGPYVAQKLIKITFLNEIQTLIEEHIINYFLLSQKKHFDQGCDINIIAEFVSK